MKRNLNSGCILDSFEEALLNFISVNLHPFDENIYVILSANN